MEEKQETSDGLGVRHTGSQRSLACYSVDENVLELLWDEEVQMEELLDFSYEHIDKLAARRGKTVTSSEKLRLWDYMERMRAERGQWITKESMAWDEVENRYVLRTKSLSLSFLPDELELIASGTQMLPPPLYTSRKPFSPLQAQGSEAASGREVFSELEPRQLLTQSEVWDVGSPSRRNITDMAQACAKKKHGWTRMLWKVFQNRTKQDSSSDTLGNYDTFITGIAMSSSPNPDVPAETAGEPPLPATLDKQRPTGFLRRSLRRVAMATKKKDSYIHTKADKM